jgi:YidC/Oxa1 family membrane protein insertase
MKFDNRNMILAIVLSIVVLFGWQFLVAGPQMEQAQRRAEIAAQQQAQSAQPAEQTLATPTTTGAGTAATPGTQAPAAGGIGSYPTREAAIAATPRVKIETPALSGSINLVGARIDDLDLKDYRETVDPTSPIITLLNPSGAPDGYFVEQGFVPADSSGMAVPNGTTQWTADAGAVLTPQSPVTLSWDNGAGLIFHRTIAVDAQYLFTITQTVENHTGTQVSLYPYARIERQGTPKVQNFFVQHEGPLALLGSNNLINKKYTDLQNDAKDGKDNTFNNTEGWLGITDKYWATAIIADPKATINGRLIDSKQGAEDVYQSSYVESTPMVVAAGGTAANTSYVFAGAKKEGILDSYQKAFGFDRLDLLIDWGWLFFFTKPLFYLLQFLYGFLGNFGLAILAVTVIVKAIFFPLASRSYASMAAMRRVQPEMKALQERFKDDRAAQQQAVMELYKKEKINPISGCWPVLIQIPVFYSLYSVLFISLEMRHAPFFGWIADLASPDPTNVFTLFGMIQWDPTMVPFIGGLLHLGVWPLVMGCTMWLQMRLNPPPPDPTQALIFNWMPVFFTFMLGSFPAGLVIYWAWNNTLSITQQYIIMRRHGAEVNLLGNIAASFKRKPKAAAE